MSECDCKFNVMKDKVPFLIIDFIDYLLDITVISVKRYEYEYTNL